MTTTTRGYGWAHQRERARWLRIVAHGGVTCARCGTPITGTRWDLGHNDDRTQWTGPECIPCNRSAGGKAATHRTERRTPEPHPALAAHTDSDEAGGDPTPCINA
jgi:hypothetical protein